MPDAEPRIETIRPGGPNKPYQALGQSYTPIVADQPYSASGLASWYGRKFHGSRTSSGEPYDMYAMTAAHPTLPIPSYVRVRNPANQREVVVRVNDRGPFHPSRIIDLSYTAALKLGLLGGVAPVEVTRLTNDDIRAGNWRRGGSEPSMPEVPTELAQRQPGATVRGSLPLSASGPAPVDIVVPPTTGTVDVAARSADLNSPAAPAPQPETAAAAPAAAATTGFWLQLGAFREREGAVGFQRQVTRELANLAPPLAIFSDHALHRLQAGPYASRDEATSAARRLREALQLVPVVVERR